MSDPLLDKMDALLKKHQGPAVAPVPAQAGPDEAIEPSEPPPLPEDAWLPVLTDVVAVGEPDAAANAGPAVESATEETPSPPPPAATIDPEAIVGRVMAGLEPMLSSLLLDRMVREVRNSLDESLSALLAQMDVHIREIVREAVSEQLNKP